jgi:Flp pilus assembly protein TadG
MSPFMSLMVRQRRHERGHLAGESGQAMVEFALILPILLLLVLGIVDFGTALGYHNDETHLSNEAARYASVNSCSGCGAQTVNAFIIGAAASNELRTHMTDKIEFGDSAGKFPGEAGYNGGSLGTKNHCVGAPVKVTLTYDYHYLNFLKLNPFTLRSSATVRLEKDWKGNSGSGLGSATDKYDVVAATASNDTC